MKVESEFSTIAFIPHFFNHKWAVELNQLLSKIFFVPDKYYNFFTGEYEFGEDSYLPGKSQLHKYISDLLPELRKNEIKKVFYCNFSYFSPISAYLTILYFTLFFPYFQIFDETALCGAKHIIRIYV